MQIVRKLSDLDLPLAQYCSDRQRFSLVPTMGALHDGHLALIAEARRRTERVLATIFVNPLQFNDSADLLRYPRTEKEDLAKLEAAGCDLVWLPTREQLYPAGFATTVSVAGISNRWDGEHRPGHFDGVATIVAKLFIATLPNVALFGEKDFQQLAVIRRMTTDLGLPIDVVGVPTVRDLDGLALSSRNAFLSTDQRQRALALPRALEEARASIESGEHILVSTLLAVARAKLVGAGFGAVDYVALVDSATLEPLDHAQGEMRLIAAATMGSTRLIDNVRVEMDTVG